MDKEVKQKRDLSPATSRVREAGGGGDLDNNSIASRRRTRKLLQL